MHSHLNLPAVLESLEDARQIEAARQAFLPWRAVLGEEPSLLSAEQIAVTLDWLASLRQHGASGNLLPWLLAEETEHRLHWWQELVSRAKDLWARVRKLQDNFLMPLHETQSTIPLVAWASQAADRNAKTTSALEVVASHSRSSDSTVHDLAQAAACLRRAMELETSLQSWRECLGAEATQLEVARIQNHRQWTTTVRGLSPAIVNWLVAADTTARCETLLGLETRWTALQQAIRQTQDTLGWFGPMQGDGPFAILAHSGTARAVEQNCEAFQSKISLLPNYARLLQHERGKQRRHLPIRKLVQRAGRAMQDLCPCWMMTPLAVAQFLAPGSIDFDLVIMDEASQINPEDAWGAIARGRQLVVVGDQKQMPPSDFFMSALEEDESLDEEEEMDGGKSESILDAAMANLQLSKFENIQGDERDIMILSCTYGPHTPGGAPTQRFGPLNRSGGERRFNVLITRAKWRMEIYSSIRSDQILVEGKQQGVRDFHLFLKYAESGLLEDRGHPTGKQSDSPFEEQVEKLLQRAGFQTERQVGVVGCFIDLAVKHPQHAGLFALGIEGDGKSYHSSRVARDRDHLREKVLLARGWKLHRIWSTDWFANPQQARKRLLDAVHAACQS